MMSYFWGSGVDCFGSYYWIGVVMMIIFWILIIAGIIWLVKYLGISSATKSTGEEKSALDILKERYTRGEIKKEEFEDKKKDLS